MESFECYDGGSILLTEAQKKGRKASYSIKDNVGEFFGEYVDTEVGLSDCDILKLKIPVSITLLESNRLVIHQKIGQGDCYPVSGTMVSYPSDDGDKIFSYLREDNTLVLKQESGWEKVCSNRKTLYKFKRKQ
ncbi:MAG: hypothetical protein HQK54_04005 [Oligoflexales bacterium]|nr:hypothetical protein [Oligoflexales bacterium]